MRKWLVFSMLLIVQLAFGQFSDEQLYMAYMSSDLTLWGQYIDAQEWEHLTHSERLRLINYEYGYIPVLADQQRTEEAARYLRQYEQHLEAEKAALPKATYLSYWSAAHAYEYLLDKSKILSEGMQSFKLAKQALETDANNPIALTLKGNIDFYAPKIIGGNKKNAMVLFARAEKIMLADSAFYYLWNLPAIQLCIAQCYEKTDDLPNALRQAEKALHRHPHFAYLRDTYLPQLKKKTTGNK